MPRTINRIELLGRVGADPEMRYTQSGTAVTQVRVATDRPRQNGETDTDWHAVTCWAKLAEAVNKYVGKGDRLYVNGRLVQNSYETQDGQRRHRAEVHAQEVVFLDSRNGGTRVAADDESDGNGPDAVEPGAESPF